jgi:K+-sensing histidine kinase KdpD
VVVVTAAVGGRAAGLISALSAALSYDFFLTTPYIPCGSTQSPN